MKKLLLFVLVAFTAFAFAANVKVLDFRTDQGYLQIANNVSWSSGDLDLGSEYTIEAWIYIKNTAHGNERIFRTNKWQIYVVSGTGADGANATVRVANTTAESDFMTGSLDISVPTEEWHHIAVLSADDYSGGKGVIRVYLDGVATQSSVQNTTIGGIVNLKIGSDGTNNFKGAVDEVRISNTHIYPYGYNQGFIITKNDPPLSSDANTVLLFHFDDNAIPPTNSSGIDFSSKITSSGISSSNYVAYDDASLLGDELLLDDGDEALPAFITKWERKTPGTDPSWFSTMENTRGIAYGEVAGNKRLYAAYDGNKVKVLNATTGADVGDLTMTDISGGFRAINTVRVSSDGKIFGSNLTLDASTSDFKVYMWDTEVSSPALAISYSDAAYRLGDNIEVKGSYLAGTAVIYAATSKYPNVLRWSQSGANGAFNVDPDVFALPNIEDANGEWGSPAYVSALGGGSSKFWASGRGLAYVREFLADGSSSTGFVDVTGIASAEYIIDLNVEEGTEFEYLACATPTSFNGQLQKISVAGTTSTNRTGTTEATFPALGSLPAKGLGDITTQANDDGSFTVYVLSTNNGIGAYQVLLRHENGSPITLASFVAEAVNGVVELSWETASETNNANFVIYRNGQPIAMIEGAGTSSETNSYTYIDNTVIPGASYTYVLADVDYDQEETRYESKAVSVMLDDLQITQSFKLGRAYPNPFNPTTILPLELTNSANVHVSLFDINGRLVKEIMNSELNAGTHDIRVNSENMSSGTYLVRAIVGSSVSVQKISFNK